MKRSLLVCSLFLSAAVSNLAFAGCDAPNDPEIPDGASASGADMLKAKKSVESFVNDAEQYLGCGVASALQERMISKRDRVVEKFNKELHVYKAKG